MNSRIKTNKRTNALHCHRPSTIDAQYTEKLLWNSALIKNNFPRKMFCFLQAATQVVPPLDWHQNWHSKYTRLTLAETPTSCWSQLDFRCIWPGCQKCFWAKKWNCKVNRSDSELNRKRTLRLFGCVNWHDDHNLFGWSWRKLTSNRFLGGAARIVLVQCFTKNYYYAFKKISHRRTHKRGKNNCVKKNTLIIAILYLHSSANLEWKKLCTRTIWIHLARTLWIERRKNAWNHRGSYENWRVLVTVALHMVYI